MSRLTAPLAAYIKGRIMALEGACFPHQESEEEQESFTTIGRVRVGVFLAELDEAAFNEGFDRAIETLVSRGEAQRYPVNHRRLRRAAYLQART